MSHEITLELLADMPSLERADKALDDFASAMAWPEQSLFQVRLVLEEILMNVISHGSDGKSVPDVRLHMAQQEDLLSMEIADNGIAFDPLQVAPPDLDADIEDRAIGGLGVFLVREMMDSVSYRRVDDWNLLAVTKSVR